MLFFTVAASLLLAISVGQTEVHLYVKPSPTSSSCPQDEVCMTLSDCLQSVSDYFTSNTTIHFLPGNHTISDPRNELVVVSNVHNLRLLGDAEGTVLHCAKRLGFVFVNVTNLTILSIRITACGEIVSNLVSDMYFDIKLHSETKAAVVLVNIHSLELQNVRIEVSYGYGLLGVSVLGNSTITNCTFTHNMWRSDDASTSTENRPGGNALLIHSCYNSQSCTKSQLQTGTLHISRCEFAHGVDTTTLDFQRLKELSMLGASGGSGLGVLLYYKGCEYCSNNVSISITCTDSIFHHNIAPYGLGANMLIFHSSSYKYIKYSNYAIYINNCTLNDGKALQGGGLFVGSTYRGFKHIQGHRFKFEMLTSTIISNLAESDGGGLSLMSDKIISETSTRYRYRPDYLIKNCIFSNNKAMQGAGVQLIGSEHLLESDRYGNEVHIKFLGTIFLKNVAKRRGGGMDVMSYGRMHITTHIISCIFTTNKAESGFAVSVNYGIENSIVFSDTVVTNNGMTEQSRIGPCAAAFCTKNGKVLLTNSTFSANNGSGVYANSSSLFISSLVNFIGNRGISGGGLYFDCWSELFLYPKSRLYMVNNTASFRGGAMAAKDCSNECFIHVALLTFNEEYVNNPLVQHFGMKTGDEECFSSASMTVRERTECLGMKIIMENNSARIAGDAIYSGSLETCYQPYFVSMDITFQTIFEILNTRSLSEVASDPFQVCFCDKNLKMNELECVTETQAEAYHGQMVQIPAVGVGQFNNASPSVVRTIITSNMDGLLLREKQSVQELGRDCGLLTYIFKSSKDHDYNAELQISVESTHQNNPAVPAVVHVSISGCPSGFEFSKDLFMCDCEPHLKKQAIRCDIDDQKIYHPAAMWIGYYQKQVVLHTNCPFHYCKLEEGAGIQLDNQDDQCAFNHSGVLCGGCQQGLSLALGTSQCLKCSNVYLLLLIPFALAGVALVFLLLKCNLTVSVGSINGLIFYVNIIQVNHTTFFPQGTEGMNLFTKFLSIFIAWLNLDFGIQTCFFTGMTAYTKTWLQFVFPAYVWIMVGFMIYGSRHFPTVSRLMGSNAVQVLATLFLLSYAKLLRTVIAAALSTTLTGKSSSTPLVWLLDGNVSLFRGAHNVLLLMALAIILIYIIPLTILVLLAPYLQSNSNYRIFKLVNIKLKPLLDAYQGPYKDKFGYWTGLMLLMRVVLFAVFAGNILGKPEINLFAVVASIQFLEKNPGRVYKNVLWNILESFYLLNLVILSAATLLLRGLNEPSTSSSQEIVTDIMVGTAFAVFCAIMLYHFCVYVLKTPTTQTKIKQAMQTLLRKVYRNQEQPTRITSGVNPCPTAPTNVHTISHFELNQLREPLLSGTFND